MRYQIRLLDLNLPGLTRELAKSCWHAADGIVQKPLSNALYRDLYRGVREVFRNHVTAFRYCNAARVCERSIPRNLLNLLPRHEKFAGEHVHVYLIRPDEPPKQIIRELVQKTVKAAAENLPGQHLPGLASSLRHAIEKTLDGRLFLSERCGEDNLCHANESYDPWDLRDPINLIRAAL
jgi:hypothetical protein